jgi:hypothetical protein
VQQLAAAEAEPANKKLNVGQLQSYLLGNTYMKVLSIRDGDKDQATVLTTPYQSTCQLAGTCVQASPLCGARSR